MKKEDADCPKKNSADQGFFVQGEAKSKEDKVSAEEVDSYSKSKDQKALPDWIMAIASCVLVVITGVYAYYTYRLVVLTRNTLETTTEAIRVEQRPWVGYFGCTIEARENSNVAWEKREPRAGENFRVTFSIKNFGQTPALNLQPASKIGIFEAGYTPSAPDEWHFGSMKNVIFPRADGFRQFSEEVSLTSQDFLEYSTHKMELYFWARLYYCDGAGRRYWTRIVFSHGFASDRNVVVSSSVGTESGETRHPDCED